MKTATGTTVITNGQLIDGTGAAAGPRRRRRHPRRPHRLRRPGRRGAAGPARRAGASTPAAARSCRAWSRRTSTPTYFNVAALEDLDIKYPVEYVTLLAAAQRQAGAGVRLHGGPQRRQPVQHRRLAEEGDRERPRPRPAPGGQRPGDLRRRRADGLEPRLPQDRHGGAGPARQRPRRGPRRRAQAGQGRRRVGQDLPDRRRRRPGHQRPSHAVHDLRGDARRRRHGPQPRR